MKVMEKTVMLGEDEAYLFSLMGQCTSHEMDKRFDFAADAVSEKVQTFEMYHDRRISSEFDDGMILDLKYMYVSNGGWEFAGATFGPRDFLICDAEECKLDGPRLVCGLVSYPTEGILGDYVYVHENDFYIVSVKNRLGAGC